MPLTESDRAGDAAVSGLQGVHVLLVEDSWQVADALEASA